MAPDSFRRFMDLPTELRQEIYLLATPPRVVHVNESDEYHSTFIARHYKSPQQLEVHPSISHFACNWRNEVPVADDKSELPLPCPSYLKRHLDIAWNFTKDAYLWSSAPIPVLLHTCRDSRTWLMRRGYELTFRTRSFGPRTWFNFDRDTLYLKQDSGSHDSRGIAYSNRVLTGCDWNFSQFHPRDMERVRRVALGRSPENYFPWLPSDPQFYRYDGLEPVTRLFGGLDEILLVEWTGQDLGYMRDADGQYLREYLPAQSRYDTRNLSTCFELCEIDVLLQAFPPLSSCLRPRTLYADGLPFRYPGRLSALTIAGPMGTFPILPDELKQEGLSSLQVVHEAMEKRLARMRDWTISADDSVSRWKIPKVKSAHLITLLEHQLIERERQKALERFHEKRRQWANFITEDRIGTARNRFGPGYTKRRNLYLAETTVAQRAWLEKAESPW